MMKCHPTGVVRLFLRLLPRFRNSSFSTRSRDGLGRRVTSLCSRGHPQSEAGRSAFRCYVNRSPMCLGDFGTDIEAQAETFAAVAHTAPEKRLEEPLKGRGLNRLSRVGDGKLELAAIRPSAHLNRRVRRAIDKCIAKKVREKLPDALAIAFDWLPQIDIDHDIALRVNPPEFLDDLQENRFQRLFTIARGDKPAAQTASCKVEHVFDKLGHARNAALYLPGDLGCSFGTAHQKPVFPRRLRPAGF